MGMMSHFELKSLTSCMPNVMVTVAIYSKSVRGFCSYILNQLETSSNGPSGLLKHVETLDSVSTIQRTSMKSSTHNIVKVPCESVLPFTSYKPKNLAKW